VGDPDLLRGAAAPEGLAQAFLIGKEFIGRDKVCLILGTTFFTVTGSNRSLKRAAAIESGALIFGYWVRDPERYGVVESDRSGKVLSIRGEADCGRSRNSPSPVSYFCDNNVVEIAGAVETFRTR